MLFKDKVPPFRVERRLCTNPRCSDPQCSGVFGGAIERLRIRWECEGRPAGLVGMVVPGELVQEVFLLLDDDSLIVHYDGCDMLCLAGRGNAEQIVARLGTTARVPSDAFALLCVQRARGVNRVEVVRDVRRNVEVS